MTSVVSIVRDISRRKPAEEERRRLAAAVEHAADAIMVTDADWVVQYVNPAFEKVTGYSKEEVLGRNPYVLAADGVNIRAYLGIEKKIRSGSPWKGRLRNRRKDSIRLDQDIVISPIRDHAGKVVNHVVAARDITREALLQKQAQTAQRMEAVRHPRRRDRPPFQQRADGDHRVRGPAPHAPRRSRSFGDVDEILKCAERAASREGGCSPSPAAR